MRTFPTENQAKWDFRFLELAKFISSWSKDPSTRVGAVLTEDKRVVSIGFNGLPQGVEDKEEILNNRELKYEQVVHGEVNCYIFSGRTNLKGLTLYTYPFLPCSRCASIFIQAKVDRVVSLELEVKDFERWGKSINISKENFHQAGIKVDTYCRERISWITGGVFN